MSQEEFEQFQQSELATIKKTQAKIESYQQQANQPGIDKRKKEIFLNNVKTYENNLKFHQKKLELAHPENPEEKAEKSRISTTYAKIIKEMIPEEEPVFFHGVRSLCYLEDILSSGHLGYLDDVATRSTTSPGTLDTTTKDSISTTINGFLGLEYGGFDRFMPAGCLFVIAPKDEAEKAYAKQDTGSQHEIKTVDFKRNPERILAIVSTTQNQDYIKGLAQKYGIPLEKVCSFDGFIEQTQQKKKTKNMETPSVQKELSPSEKPRQNMTDILRQQKELGDKKLLVVKTLQSESGRK